MGGRAAGASAPGSAFAPHAAAGASWMQNRSIGKVGVPENYGQIDGVGTKFLGTPANHREVRHERIETHPAPAFRGGAFRATTRRATPLAHPRHRRSRATAVHAAPSPAAQAMIATAATEIAATRVKCLCLDRLFQVS